MACAHLRSQHIRGIRAVAALLAALASGAAAAVATLTVEQSVVPLCPRCDDHVRICPLFACVAGPASPIWRSALADAVLIGLAIVALVLLAVRRWAR